MSHGIFPAEAYAPATPHYPPAPLKRLVPWSLLDKEYRLVLAIDDIVNASIEDGLSAADCRSALTYATDRVTRRMLG